MAKPTSKQKLNIRERKFIKNLMSGMNATEAMRQAGYAENTATAKKSEKLRKVATTIQELMDKRGLSDDKLLDVMESALSATKVITSPTGPDFTFPDWQAKLKALELACKVKRHLTDRVEHSGAVEHVITHKIIHEGGS